MASSVLQFPTPPAATANVAATAVDTDTERHELMLPVAKLKKQLNDYLGSKTDENDEAQQADRYFHAKQWTDDELKVLKERNQPEIVYNRIKRKINTVVGILEKARQDPKAYPRHPKPGAEDGSEIATQTLMYALGWDWQSMSANVFRRASVRAISGVSMEITQGDQGDPDIELDEVDQRDYFYDPKSSKPDFSDVGFEGTTKWIPMYQAESTWSDRAEELKGLKDSTPEAWDKNDTRRLNWYNKVDDEIRVVDHWYRRGGQWFYAIYCGDVILEEGESPFNDHKGRPISKYIMMACEVDHDNNRYGFFRDLKGPQDEINHRRSKGLHALNSRRIIAEVGAVDDVDLARREAVRSDGFLLKNSGYSLEIVENTNDVQQNLEMLQEAKSEIDTYGPNPGLIGSTVEASSGRAIQLLQAAGIAEMGTFMLSAKNWKLRVYRSMWSACQRYWTAERFIRVTQQEGMAEFVQVNGWQIDPQNNQPVMFNQLAALDVDIILDEGPDTINTQADTYDTLVAMASKGTQVPPDVLIELSALPSSTKKRVMELLKISQQPKPMDEQALVLKLQEIMANIQKTQALAAKAQAETQEITATIGQQDGNIQVDTPADLAKARLDMAKAAEIEHNIMNPAPQPQPTIFDAQEQTAKARASDAQAMETTARAQRMTVETSNLARYGAAEPAKIRPEQPKKDS